MIRTATQPLQYTITLLPNLGPNIFRSSFNLLGSHVQFSISSFSLKANTHRTQSICQKPAIDLGQQGQDSKIWKKGKQRICFHAMPVPMPCLSSLSYLIHFLHTNDDIAPFLLRLPPHHQEKLPTTRETIREMHRETHHLQNHEVATNTTMTTKTNHQLPNRVEIVPTLEKKSLLNLVPKSITTTKRTVRNPDPRNTTTTTKTTTSLGPSDQIHATHTPTTIVHIESQNPEWMTPKSRRVVAREIEVL